jgi:hypothetical protein
MTDESFDFHAVLTGRKYPTGSIRVWFDDEPWYELEALEERHSRLGADDPQLKVVEEQFEQVNQKIAESAYTVHVRGISPRASEDLLSSALSHFPIKRDMYGRDDDIQALKRNQDIALLSFAAHITKVVNPDGATVEFNDDNKLDLARGILNEAPKSAISAIDAAIAQVSREFAEQQARYTSPDFS